MCGIAGILSAQDTAEEAAVRAMTATLAHRGPDDQGYWRDAERGVSLGHRRLSIIDLSPEGHQPMVSDSGRYVIAFNGEVYNFAELREDLEPLGHPFRGHSDTEVMLAAIEQWGLRAAVERFVGMFAFALWDREARSLALVRDRLGIKPLYYGWAEKALLFGSELKALRAFPGFANPVNRDALTLLLRHNYVPAPHSIYRHVHKLMPGTIVTLRRADAAGPLGGEAIAGRTETYWSAGEVAERGTQSPLDLSDAEATDELERKLREAVRLRMVADVPLGAFLSGGVDSSTVVALMQAQSPRPVRTFSIGFHEQEYDEAQHAAAVARHLGTEHTELYVTPREAMDVIPRLPALYDEPFADSSQIPTFLVSALARRHVTVSLSGDGGDELFAGYNRYFWTQRLWRKLRWVPAPLRNATARAIRTGSPAFWDRALNLAMPLLHRRLRVRLPGDKAHRLAEVLALATPDAVYHQLVSHWTEPAQVVIDGQEPETALTNPARQAKLADQRLRMMYLDLVSYLPDDILVKVDRASMGVSLEARVPLIDHRVVEYAWRLPLSMKFRDGEGKWLLRQVLYRHVPRALIERPKMGFGVPIDHWLRGPLRDWAETLLDPSRLKDEGYFRAEPIQRKWAEHLSGDRNWSYYLWDVLMFQAWLEEAHAGRHARAATTA